MKIKAAVVREQSGPFKIEEVELDEPRDDEVLVRIVGSGICGTDLAPGPGIYPFHHLQVSSDTKGRALLKRWENR